MSANALSSSSHARHSMGLPTSTSSANARDDTKATCLYCEESPRSNGRHALWNENERHTTRLYCDESPRSNGRHALWNEGHTVIS
ncbi:hypothetical protein ACROYT_G004243 [Oculina patagonica]